MYPEERTHSINASLRRVALSTTRFQSQTDFWHFEIHLRERFDGESSVTRERGICVKFLDFSLRAGPEVKI